MSITTASAARISENWQPSVTRRIFVPRPLRIQYPNAAYHVMNRGRAKCTIFHGYRWYRAFLTCLEEAHNRFGAQIHAFCLMTNHYHLLVKTPEANLDRIMRHINGVYTQRHNALANTDGPLLRGRYKALVVEQATYWHGLSRYVHRNPIEMNTPLVDCLEAYPWSSYPYYLGLKPAPSWMYMQETLALSGVNTYEEYKNFVELGNSQSLKDALTECKRQAPILGADNFKKHLLDQFSSTPKNTANWQMRSTRPTIDFIRKQVSEYYGVPIDSLRMANTQSRTTCLPRLVAMHLCQHNGGHPIRQIGDHFGYQSYGGAANALFRLRRMIGDDVSLQRDIAILHRRIAVIKTT